MKSMEVRELKICAAATAIALATVFAGACSQQSVGNPSGWTPVGPTPVTENVTSSDQEPAAAGQADTELLCHARGNGTFAALSVNANAVDAHLLHGDGRPLNQAPGGLFVFTSACEVVANIAGVWLGESITFDPNA